MSKINTLEAAAKATHRGEWTATAGYLEEGGQCAFGREHRLDDESEGCEEHDPSDEETHRAEQDAAFIARASPLVVLDLITALRAYEELLVWHRAGNTGCNPELDDNALAALIRLKDEEI